MPGDDELHIAERLLRLGQAIRQRRDSACERPQLRSAGLPATITQILTFCRGEGDASLSAAADTRRERDPGAACVPIELPSRAVHTHRSLLQSYRDLELQRHCQGLVRATSKFVTL